jgi:hypothetical protein
MSTKANWKEYKSFHEESPRYYLQINILETEIHENLAIIKKRTDGRYKYNVNATTFYKDIWQGNNQQGVTNTVEEAKAKVEEIGWIKESV